MQGSISVSIYLSYTATFAQSIRDADNAGNSDSRLSLYKESREDRFLVSRMLLNEFHLRLDEPQLFDKKYNFLYRGIIREDQISCISKRFKDLYNNPPYSEMHYKDFLLQIISSKIKEVVNATAKTVTTYDISVSFAEKEESTSVF